ncbi:MAG: MAPEG family protein [Lautropia sp.]|nr:MAPEG family protein [Lautropia sp.]
MEGIHFIVILAIAQYLYFGFQVGRARSQYDIKAPAVGGHEMFDRALRIQQNTMEVLVAFIPALYVAAAYWPHWLVVIIGTVYLVGRMIYRHNYLIAPDSRATGFLLSIVPVFLLLLLGLLGVIFG